MPRGRAAASRSDAGGSASNAVARQSSDADASSSADAASLVPGEDTGMSPKLQNVVCTVTLGCPLDLKRITLHARNAEYNPKRYARTRRDWLAGPWVRTMPLIAGYPPQIRRRNYADTRTENDGAHIRIWEGAITQHLRTTSTQDETTNLACWLAGVRWSDGMHGR